jgi:FkbM family methyltransferase
LPNIVRMRRPGGRAARVRHAVRGRVQATLGRAGWEVRPTTTDSDKRRARLLASEEIDLVLDIGANVGQYGMRLRNNGYRGRIVSFEPYAQAFNQLRRTASRDPLWDAHRLALSDKEGEAELNVSGNSFSSSLLPLTRQHLVSAPGSAYVATEVIRTARLDSLWSDVVGSARPWLKLDVQGFEMSVLLGAGDRVREVHALEVELSVVPLYDGAVAWTTMVGWLGDRGFELAAVEPGFDDPTSGRMLQFDGIFLRR